MEIWLFLGTALITGLASSLHCLGMCGPLALAVAATGATNKTAQKFSYHAGRISTYALIGFALGFIGHNVLLFNTLQKFALFFSLILLAYLISKKQSIWVGKFFQTLMRSIRKWQAKYPLFASAALGIANGLLPCSMLYLALIGAVASGQPILGAMYMVFFGLGTVPAFLFFSHIWKKIPLPFVRKYSTVLSSLLVVWLVFRGLGLGIPYLSPSLENGPAICHYTF